MPRKEARLTEAGNILMTIAIVSALCGVIFAVSIVSALEARGVKINWIWLRVLIVSRYLGLYRETTRKETGRPGPLYYGYVISMALALVFAIAGLALRAAGSR